MIKIKLLDKSSEGKTIEYNGAIPREGELIKYKSEVYRVSYLKHNIETEEIFVYADMNF